jgi:hypothetical protein
MRDSRREIGTVTGMEPLSEAEPLREANPVDVAEQVRDAADWPDDEMATSDREVDLESDPADYVEQQQIVVDVEDEADERRD